MVQGTPAVDWKNPANNAKLFAAVLALLNGTPDYKLIAAAFGESAATVASFDHQKQIYGRIAMRLTS